ncbi:hypothetical protein MBLNU459_g2239t4 [Dothideomycetes sp. NU459]
MAALDYKVYLRNYEGDMARFQKDLLSLGYEKRSVRRFTKRCDLITANDLIAHSLPAVGKGRKGRYQPLRLYKATDNRNKNWVLFDPRKGIPNSINFFDLPLLIKLAFYKPGNERYLEYNTSSHAIRMRLVRPNFVGKCITYTVNGPVLAAIKAESDSELTELESGEGA